MAPKKYRVTYEHDEDGYWVATVQGLKGVHTQGRSIEAAKTRIAEALAAAVEDTKDIELVHHIIVKNGVRTIIGKIEKARAIAEREQTRAAELTRQVVQELTGEMSVRDAGAVLGITGQRVQQLLQGK